MKRFSANRCFAQNGKHVLEFVHDYFSNQRKTLFISTLGIQPQSLFFPAHVFSQFPEVDLRIIVERRREVSPTLAEIGNQHRAYVQANAAKADLQFIDVNIVANDDATVGGRNAVNQARDWYKQSYTDIVIDATGMSRGVCFPLVQQAIEVGLRSNSNVHLLVASNDVRSVTHLRVE